MRSAHPDYPWNDVPHRAVGYRGLRNIEVWAYDNEQPEGVPLNPQTRQAPHLEHRALVQQASTAAVAASRDFRALLQPNSCNRPHQQSQENTGSNTTSAACLRRETATWSA